MGRIGQAIARRGALGFGMSVIYHNRSRLDADVERALGARWVDKNTLLRQSDHLLLVLPYSAASHHAIGAAELALMRPTATLINIARGGVVDDRALAEALRERRIAAAGLDVFEGEPALHPGAARTAERGVDAAHRQRQLADAAGHGQPGGRQPDCCTGWRHAADCVEPAGAAAGLTAERGFGLPLPACSALGRTWASWTIRS